MPFEDGQRYDGTVIAAGYFVSSKKGTPFLGFKIRTSQGVTAHREYLTANTAARVAKTMLQCFGITRDQLATENYLESINSNPNILNAAVSIVMKSEEVRPGKFEMKVKWMNPGGARRAGKDAVSKAAKLFSGDAEPDPAGIDDWPDDTHSGF